MNLFIYDISTFIRTSDIGNFQTSISGVPLILDQDISNPTFVNDTSRQCTNLILIDNTKLLMTCLAAGGNGDNTAFVTVDITNFNKAVPSYMISTRLSFSALRDGKFTYL